MTYSNPSNPDRDRYQPTKWHDYPAFIGKFVAWVLVFFILAPLALGVTIVGILQAITWVLSQL